MKSVQIRLSYNPKGTCNLEQRKAKRFSTRENFAFLEDMWRCIEIVLGVITLEGVLLASSGLARDVVNHPFVYK